MTSSQPLDLEVDPELHAHEIERFFASVLKGPNQDDCWLWLRPPRDDGYGQFPLYRNGQDRIVRAHRYALAIVHPGPLSVDTHGLHTCNLTICVRAELDEQLTHLLPGTHADNMAQMSRQGRGGGSPLFWKWRGTNRAALVTRARAIQQACKHGWDAEAIADAKSRHPIPGQEVLF